MKTCPSCKQTLMTSFFGKCISLKDGLSYTCKPCRVEHYQKNKAEINIKKNKRRKGNPKYLATDKLYKLNNKEKLSILRKKNYIKRAEKERVRCLKYYHDNKEKLIPKKILRNKIKRTTIPFYNLKERYRSRIKNIFKLKNQKKAFKSLQILGCTYENLLLHIENQFKPGMTWDNRKEWHIDHIIPLAIAKTEEELYKLNHYTNLQPLWAKENLSKGAKT